MTTLSCSNDARRKFNLRRLLAGWVAAALLPLAVAPSASAQGVTVPGPWGAIVDHDKPLEFGSDAERATYLRRLAMRAISAHFRSVEAVVTYGAKAAPGETANDARALVDKAAALSFLFAERTPAAAGKPGAREEIWLQPEKFARHVEGFRAATAKLASSVASQSGGAEALVGVRHECLACHQSYRQTAAAR
jgi:cytochrome c556